MAAAFTSSGRYKEFYLTNKKSDTDLVKGKLIMTFGGVKIITMNWYLISLPKLSSNQKFCLISEDMVNLVCVRKKRVVLKSIVKKGLVIKR